MRRLQKDVAGGVRNRAVRAAHHAAQRRAGFAVGDKQVGRAAFGDDVVNQQFDFFPAPGEADADFAGQLFQVKGVQRLPECEGEIVCRVHRGADGAHSAALHKRARPPKRGGGGVHIAHQNASVIRAGGAGVCVNGNRKRFADVRDVLAVGGADFKIKRGGGLAGDSQVTQAVAAVRSHGDIQDLVVQQEGFMQGLPGGEFGGGQLHNLVGFGGEVQFGGGAKHSGGADAAHFADGDFVSADFRAGPGERRKHSRPRVGRAADDLRGPSLAEVRLAQGQFGARNFFGMGDFRGDNLPLGARPGGDTLHLQAARGQQRGEVRRGGKFAAHKFGEPFAGYFHEVDSTRFFAKTKTLTGIFFRLF